MSLTRLFSKQKCIENQSIICDLIKQKDRQLSVLFQPIYNLDTGSVMGHEALCRGPKDSELFSPLKLFELAEQQNMLYPLENLVREMSIRKFKSFGLQSKLFLNLTPKIVNEPGFAKGQTRRLIRHLGLRPDQIVFEITERHSITDFTAFQKALEHYRNQGFLVAVDDAGAGYSSLQAIAELQPDFIKLDMSLIRSIETNATKKALLETFVTLSEKIKSALIAEGIETEQEFKVIRQLGVGFGQGYYLSKPMSGPPWPALSFENIASSNELDTRLTNLITPVPLLPKSASITEAIRLFNNNDNQHAIVVVEKGAPAGIITRNKIMKFMEPQYENTQILFQPVSTVMDTNPLVAKLGFSLSTICQLITYRTESKLNDFVVLTSQGNVIGVLPVHLVLSKFISQSIEKNRL